MLVLTRHPNQSIMIGDEVVVTVLEVRGDQVRLGIRAPRTVAVHREEVFAALQAANRQASKPAAGALGALGGVKSQTGAAPPKMPVAPPKPRPPKPAPPTEPAT